MEVGLSEVIIRPAANSGRITATQK